MKPVFKYLLVGLSIALAMTLSFAAMIYLEHRASKRILKALHQVEPGMPISTVRGRLGQEMYGIDEIVWIERNASIKDPEFLKNKKLYWFYISTPPCRVIEVYADREDRVIYATWQGL